jgi:heme/copper-type cytochrome/quinol oxidase subunit 3
MRKIKLMFGMLFSVVLALSFVSADVGEYDHGMGAMMYGSYGYGGMFFSWVTGLLFIAVLVLLIVWLIKQIEKK